MQKALYPVIIFLVLGLFYFLFATLFPSSPTELLEGRLAGNSGGSSICSEAALAAREIDHKAGVGFRHSLVRKWAPKNSVESWDYEVPMDSPKAWESPNVWDVFAPTYGCLRPLRVGGVAAQSWTTQFPLESKVVCNPTLLRSAMPCVIYSFGVGWDTTFESSMLRMAPHCKVRVFDPTTTEEKFWELVKAQTLDGEAPPKPPSLTFNKVGLAAVTSENYKEGMLWNNMESINVMTLEDIMKKHGDERLSILKVDIEGSEWTALPQAAQTGALAKADQLLLEVHMRGCEKGYVAHDRTKLAGLLDALEGVGLRSFALVPNLVPVSKGAYPGCAEYSFVNIHSKFVTESCVA